MLFGLDTAIRLPTLSDHEPCHRQCFIPFEGNNNRHERRALTLINSNSVIEKKIKTGVTSDDLHYEKGNECVTTF